MGLPELPLHPLLAPLLLVLLLLPSTSPSTSTSTSPSIFFHSHSRLLLLLVSASFSSVSPSTSPDTQRSGILCQERDDHLHWVSTFPSKSASSKAWGYASVNLRLFYKLFLGCRLLFDRVINSPPNQFLSFFSCYLDLDLNMGAELATNQKRNGYSLQNIVSFLVRYSSMVFYCMYRNFEEKTRQKAVRVSWRPIWLWSR